MPTLRAATAPKTSPITRRPDDREHERERRVPAERQALGLPAGPALRDHVPEDEAGDAHQRRLRERDHPAVGGEEDQARRGDPEEERLRQDRADPVVAEDRPGRRAATRRTATTIARSTGLRRSARRRHPALPKRPCGRNASTSASSTNVTTIEYWVQQLCPRVGRYAAENEKHERRTGATRRRRRRATPSRR